MKKCFEIPEVTVFSIAVEDVITTSGGNGIGGSGSDTGGSHDFGERT